MFLNIVLINVFLLSGNVLYWAVVNGSLEMFEILRKRAGVDPSMRTRKGENLVHIAASLGQHELISVLVKECDIDPWHEDNNKKTPLDR